MILTKVAQNVIYMMAVIVRKFKIFLWLIFFNQTKVIVSVVDPYEDIPLYSMINTTVF